MSGWRYFATTLHGDGTETNLIPNLPLSSVTIETVLSGTNSLVGTVPVEDERLLDPDGRLLIQEWSTVIYAELDGAIRGCGIVKDITEGDATLQLTCVGFVGYLDKQPWEAKGLTFVQADAFDIARSFWANLQAVPGSNLGLRVEFDPNLTGIKLGWIPPDQWRRVYLHLPQPSVTSLKEGEPVRVYTPPKAGSDGKVQAGDVGTLQWYGYGNSHWTPGTPAWHKPWLLLNVVTGTLLLGGTGDQLPAGVRPLARLTSQGTPTYPNGNALEPYSIHAWDTPDMSSRWKDITTDGKFEFWEEHRKDSDGTIEHVLHVGHPTVGARRDVAGPGGLRFVVGENVAALPQVKIAGDEYADKVTVIGAGDGAAQINESWTVTARSGRLHRTKLVTNQGIRSKFSARSYAERLARGYAGDRAIDEVRVRNHPNAPLGSYGPGDTITVRGSGKGWAGDMTHTVRITAIGLSPDDGDVADLTVARADKAGAA